MTKDKDDKLFDEKEKRIAPVSPKGVALPQSYKPAPGTEEITSEDTTFPRFRLLQNTSSEVEAGEQKAGMVMHSLSEDVLDKIEIIPLCLIRTRVMFDPDNRKGAPICRSQDTKHGSGCDCGCENDCLKCTYGRWEKSVPPACSLVYNYPCLTPSQMGKEALPTLLSFMKSSTQSALKINTSVKWAMPPISFWYYVWELTTVAKKFKKGTAYVFNLKKLRETTEEERKWAASIYHLNVAGKKVDIDAENTE